MSESASVESYSEIREAVRALCSEFSGEYWRSIDEARAYPEAFVKAMTEASFLSALIPEEYGGLGFGITEDELTAIFPTDRNVRLIREPVKARTDAAKMRNAIEAEVARIQRGN